mmetsp:Transcript_16591/g.29377  ORF Transcript_16591/g.29377 Transcript_16591/m.29377 type:complete len:283 (-) Transcript_16591:1032-1880(-)
MNFVTYGNMSCATLWSTMCHNVPEVEPYLKANRHTISPPVRTCAENTGFTVTYNDLRTTKEHALQTLERFSTVGDLVTHFDQFSNNLFVNTILQRNLAVSSTVCNAKTGRIDGCLRVHVIVDHVDDQVDMPRGLHKASHVGKGGIEVLGITVEHQGWDDGVVRTLVRGKDVGMVFREREVSSTVLHGEAAALGNDATAKAFIVGVYHRHCISIHVHHLERHGVAAVLRRACLSVNTCLFGVDELAALRGIRRVQQALGGHVNNVLIGHIGASIRKAQPHSFD